MTRYRRFGREFFVAVVIILTGLFFLSVIPVALLYGVGKTAGFIGFLAEGLLLFGTCVYWALLESEGQKGKL